MKLYKVDITPLSLFKDVPSSYTLFGAISWGYRILYGEEKLKNLLQNFEKNNPEFLISSIFPRIGNTYYFPKPNLKAKRVDDSNFDYKKLRKVSYIEFDILKKVLENEIKNEFQLHEELTKKQIKEKVSLTAKDAIPHASIDRLYNTTEGAGNFYFEEIVTLKEGYFLIAFNNEDVKKEVVAVFRFLQDIGFGGNRSIGYGKVIFGEPEPFKEIEKYFYNKTDRFILLSPIIPEKETYEFRNSFYDYFTFRGAVDNNYDFKDVDIWKEKVIYLKEGSILKVKNPKNFYGQLYLSKSINGKKIYQYGLAFPLYIQGEQ